MADLPPLRALQVFEVVGRCKSMSQAAADLNVSPGAVSQQIKILEDALGLTLISRKSTGLRLTEFGRSYHRIVSSAFGELRRAHGEMVAARRASGLVLSALPLFASKWLAPRLFEWQLLHPDVIIHLEGTTVEPSMESGHFDFRISYRDKVRHFDRAVPLFTDKLIPVCSPGLLASGPPLEQPADLLRYRLLTIDWKPLISPAPTWQDWFRQAGVACGELRDTFVFSLSSLAIEAAMDGRGVTLAQYSLITEELRTGRLIAPFPHVLTLPSPYFLAWSDDVFDKRGARDFHRWLVGLARKQEPAGARCAGAHESLRGELS